MSSLQNNAFFVKTPEIMTAQEVLDLFVPFSDSLSIQDTGHIFIHGHRGCGKSMMFRYLSPDCQSLLLKKPIKDLPYYGVYLSVKATDLNIGELNRLQNQVSGHILSEHFLVVYLVVKTLQSIEENLSSVIDEDELVGELKKFCTDELFERLKMAGWDGCPDLSSVNTAKDVMKDVINIFEKIHAISIQHLRKLLYTAQIVPFDGVLLGFQDLLLPMMRKLKTLSFMPSKPIYLFIDDADNLSLQQTQVLNTWVSYRTTADLSLKIATQLNYKTRSTVNGQRIESTHDYSEIVISKIYTGRAKENYPKWVEDVVKRRLEMAGTEVDAKDFFPEDKEQETKIRVIAERIKAEWTSEGKGGYRPGDDAYRYARPEYIKSLGGMSKNSHKYIYAGFDQLVHISSGIIRYFLDPASKMFAQVKEDNDHQPITHIPPRTQNKVLRDEADEMMHHEFDKLIDEIEKQQEQDLQLAGTVQKIRKLRNLITVLGSVFYQYLIDSERSERRYFSFFISSEPDADVLSVIKLGIQYGYFYESFVGTKEGRGRTPLYVMTRRLAPYFKLDPMGFAAHKSLTNAFLANAIENPKAILNTLRDGANIDELVEAESEQKVLFKRLS